MDYMQLVKAVAELGILVVISALFLKQSHDTYKNAEKRGDLLLQEQIKTHREILDSVINIAGTTHVITKEENEALIEKNRLIDEYLKRLVSLTNSTKAIAVRYHNGGRDLSGNPFLKMSMTNEAVNLGYKPTIMEYQNQFQSMLSLVIERLDSCGECYIFDLEDIKDLDAGTYEFFKSVRVKVFLAKAIVSLDGQCIGFIAIHYNEDNMRHFDEKKSIELLDKTAGAVSGLLNMENR